MFVLSRFFAPFIFLFYPFQRAIATLPPVSNNPSFFSGFVENKGQVSSAGSTAANIFFNGTSGNLSFYLRTNGISYQLQRVDSWLTEQGTENSLPIKSGPVYAARAPDMLSFFRVDVDWLNAAAPQISAHGPKPGYENYYLPVCPNGALEVRSYERIHYDNIYSGIDLHWYAKDGRLKYDYIVAPGADYENIQLVIKGADSVYVNWSGELVLSTPLGEIIEQTPLVVQQGKTLRAWWVVKDNIAKFSIEGIDPETEYIIDPGVRSWGTYYGGSSYDSGNTTCTDKDQNVYLGGCATVYTTNVIATPGTMQTAAMGWHNFLAKFTPGGQRLWATYYAGGHDLLGNRVSCTSDGDGNVFLVGSTGYNSAVATSGAYQQAFSGGECDGYIVKFNSGGVRLWGTYYGGPDHDRVSTCAVDASGNLYVGGFSKSSSGISSPGSHQINFSGGNFDCFLAKFDTEGQRQWATYYGGGGSEVSYGCATDPSGNIYLSGLTDTENGSVISTPGSHQAVFGGSSDGFLVKFNPAGQRQWATYYGGPGYDFGYSCATDGEGNVYLAGVASGDNVNAIATIASHQSVYGGGVWDGFLAKFSTSGIRLWGTYYGGSDFDQVRSCVTDKENNVYITGLTWSAGGTAIATPGTQQTNFNLSGDAYLASFRSDGLRQWGTYYGGPGREDAESCSVDQLGNIYIAGKIEADAGNLLATPSAHQTSFGGSVADAFFVQFNNCIIPSQTNPVPALDIRIEPKTICSGQSVTLSATGAPKLIWLPSSTTSTAITFVANSNVTYTLVGIDSRGCRSSYNVSVDVTPMPTVNVTPFFYLCNGTASLIATGAESYSWLPGGLTGSNALVNPEVTTSYTVTGSNGNCYNSAVSVVSLGVAPPLIISSSASSGCQGGCFNFTYDPLLFQNITYDWQDGLPFTPSVSSHCYSVSADYYVSAQGTFTSGCHVISQNTIGITVFSNPDPVLELTSDAPIYKDEAVVFLNRSTGAQKFIWRFDAEPAIQIFDSEVNRIYPESGNYCVWFTAIDTLHNCADSVEKCFEILCRSELVIPNVFTPNGDDVNDVFKFDAYCINTLNCTIYNRWGTKINSFSGPNGRWDGYTDAGLAVVPGVYYFTVEYIKEDGTPIVKWGHLTVLH